MNINQITIYGLNQAQHVAGLNRLMGSQFPTQCTYKQTITIVCDVRVTRSFMCFVDRCLSFCPFFFWPLSCLFFFDIRILITPVVSSNSSYSIGSFVCVYFSEDHSALYYHLSFNIYNVHQYCILLRMISAEAS